MRPAPVSASRTARRLAKPCGVPGSMSTSICSHASQSFSGHTAGAWQLPARRAYSPRTPAPARGKRLLAVKSHAAHSRLHASGFAHQLLADGAHRGLAFQTRRPFQPQQRVRRKRHRARTRAAVQHGFGRKSASPPAPRSAPLSPLPPSRACATAHRPPPRSSRVSRPPALARLQAIRLADRARIFFERAARISRRDRLKRGLPIRHAVPPSSAAPRRA